MKENLKEFRVAETDLDGSIVVAALDGKQIVVARILRSALDDYASKFFNRPHLSDEDCLALIQGNLTAIASTVGRKYARGLSSTTHRAGSNVKMLDIDFDDLSKGTRLLMRR